MMSAVPHNLPVSRRALMMRAGVTFATLVTLSLSAACAFAQQKPDSEELDVTLQIIADPDAKRPDEVIRRIPLPARKPDAAAAGGRKESTSTDADGKDKNNERAREASEFGRETSDSAKERAQEAAEQREEARRSAAEERRREHERDPPGRPDRPDRPDRPQPPARP